MSSTQWGGKRPGAGRKPSYKRIQLTDYQAELLGKLIDDAELIDHPTTANVIVGTILREALTNDYKRWVETFRQTAQGSQQKALDSLRDYAKAPAPELPQAARALMATLTPEREPVATVYRRLNWGRQMLEQTISQHRAELERAGLRLHVATHSEASGRLDRYITVDGTRYSTLSRG